MLLEAKHKSQYKEIDFNGEAEDELEKYIDFLYKKSKRFKDEIKDKNEYEIDEIEEKWKNKLEKELKEKLERTFNHRKSIYPSDTEYGEDNMLVNTTNQRVIFYEIYKNKDNEKCVTIHKCPHYKDFIKDLEKKGIEPKEDADPNILLDLLELERHITVKESPNEELPKEIEEEFKKRKNELEKKLDGWEKGQKSENTSKRDNTDNETSKEEKKEEITDPETGKKIKKVKHIGERGGKYYIDDNGNKVYPSEWNESVKNIKEILLESLSKSKIKSLCEYIKIKMVG